MTGSEKPEPPGYPTATTCLNVKGAIKALAFYQNAFDATEVFCMDGPDGRVGHAEIRIGNSPIMLADEFPEIGAKSPETLGGSPVSILLYVDDVDTVFNRAVAAGAKVLRPVTNQFYGDRSGGVIDPFGHSWHISTHSEVVPPEELHRRSQAAKKPEPSAT